MILIQSLEEDVGGCIRIKNSLSCVEWDFSCQQQTAVRPLSRLLAQLQNHLTPRSSPTVSHAVQTFGRRLDGNPPQEASALRLSLWGTFRNEASFSLTFRTRIIHTLSHAPPRAQALTCSTLSSNQTSEPRCSRQRNFFPDALLRRTRCSARDPFGGCPGPHQKSSAI